MFLMNNYVMKIVT